MIAQQRSLDTARHPIWYARIGLHCDLARNDLARGNLARPDLQCYDQVRCGVRAAIANA